MLKISMLSISLLMAGLGVSVAYAASDACCAAPTCFCYKDTAGDWKKGTLANTPPNAQTKGLQFLPRSKTSTPVPAIQSKASCTAGGGVWDGGVGGTGGCIPGGGPLK